MLLDGELVMLGTSVTARDVCKLLRAHVLHCRLAPAPAVERQTWPAFWATSQISASKARAGGRPES